MFLIMWLGCCHRDISLRKIRQFFLVINEQLPYWTEMHLTFNDGTTVLIGSPTKSFHTWWTRITNQCECFIWLVNQASSSRAASLNTGSVNANEFPTTKPNNSICHHQTRCKKNNSNCNYCDFSSKKSICDLHLGISVLGGYFRNRGVKGKRMMSWSLCVIEWVFFMQITWWRPFVCQTCYILSTFHKKIWNLSSWCT